MDKSELIAEFKAQLEHFGKFQSFIDKARSYADKFNPAVVEKVIADNSEKIRGVAERLNPLVAEMRAIIAGLEDEREAIVRGVGDARLAVEELDLRRAIGEVDDATFEAETAGLRSEVSSADERIAAVEADLDAFRGTLDHWLASRPAGEDDGGLEEDLLQEEEEEGVDLEADAGADDVAVGGPEEELGGFEDEGRGKGVHTEARNVQDDVSELFEGGEEPAPIEEGALEAEDAGIDFAPDEIADLGSELVAAPKDESAPATALEGRAVLIVGEGTAEEHIYPFSGDAISMGRGRDNTIQVKNDSKVSRYHCRVFREAGQYYVEDNKSANGTLVDGELITKKRLFGGEEVIVGETFFRFRIQ
jgi:hypothetical protein